MDLTRRRFLEAALTLVTSAGLSGVSGVAKAATTLVAVPASLGRTSTALEEIIGRYARLEDDPWALMHGVRAMGPDFTIKGENAVTFLCSRFLKQKSVSGMSYLYMPVDLEGHTNAFLKTVLEAGVPPSNPFQLDGKRYTVADLVKSAKALFVFDPKTIDRDDLAWTLIAFSLQIPPDRDTWTNAFGQRLRFSDVIRFSFDALDDATQQLRRAMDRGIMPEAKDKIHEFTCGGTHLVYGLASCVGNGYHGENFPRRLKTHLDLLVWRLGAEDNLMRRFYRQAPPSPDLEKIYDLYRNDAKLKFYGHSFEILSYAGLRHLFAPTPAQGRAIEKAGATLAEAVKGMVGVDLFEIRKRDPRLFALLIGDSCHAYHGIHMAPGTNEV